MKINAMSLHARVKNKVKELNVDSNILFNSYYFDCFLNRIAKSNYSDNFVFKGGFLLTSILGIQNRFTMDIDLSFRKKEFSKENLERIINEIANIYCEDLVTFNINKVSQIRDEDEYGGYRFKLDVKFENLKSMITIDIATGDPITPSEIDYKYKCLLTGEEFFFKSYNLETILAEKLQTILTRGLANSRSKDYYDVYIIYKLKRNQINFKHLKDAFAKTCIYRNTLFTSEEINSIINAIEVSDILKERWTAYSKKMKFANEINYHEIVEILRMVSAYLVEVKELISV